MNCPRISIKMRGGFPEQDFVGGIPRILNFK
jgi:hypothetical protein